jgi:hypothetical protein
VNSYIEKNFERIKTSLSQQQRFTVDDVVRILGSKRSTALWLLSNLSRSGKLARIGRGVYTFEEKNLSFRSLRLSNAFISAIDKLKKEGVSFVVTGMDILFPFVQHQPSRILHLIYTASGAGPWAQSLLKDSEFTPVLEPTRQEIEKVIEIAPDTKELIILRDKSSQLATIDSMATIERAFVDLYIEATRELIPFSVQEVVYIFINMKSTITINTSQMLRYAHERSIRSEINEILNFTKGNSYSTFEKPLQNFLRILETIA